MLVLYLVIFVISFAVLARSSGHLVNSLTKIARFLGWKEFVVAFFTVALAGAIPNLSVGLSSAFHGVPQLSFGDIIGGNIVDLTIAIALAAFVSRKGLSLPSRMVQGSAIFMMIIVLFPLLLTFDGILSRGDGLLLILAFLAYVYWLFGEKGRFSKDYNCQEEKKLGLKEVFGNVGELIGAILLLFLAAEGIVRSATYFSEAFNLPVILIGVLVLGLGNASPEIFFGIQAARKGQDWMVVGNLMGSVIFPATLVLGIVAMISPIEVGGSSYFAVGRLFLFIAAVFSLLFLRTGRKITRQEGFFLLAVYLLFVVAEIAVCE